MCYRYCSVGNFQRMYASYCSNCKFTTVKSLPRINYMRNSLVEIMALKPYIAYKRVCMDKKILATKLYESLYGYKNLREKKPEKGGGKKRKKEKQVSHALKLILSFEEVDRICK